MADFLRHLAATNNVSIAAKAAGMAIFVLQTVTLSGWMRMSA
ncbi:MAG: hypothetical protein ABJN65_08090 [Parasphingorhabdus sp.]